MATECQPEWWCEVSTRLKMMHERLTGRSFRTWWNAADSNIVCTMRDLYSKGHLREFGDVAEVDSIHLLFLRNTREPYYLHGSGTYDRVEPVLGVRAVIYFLYLRAFLFTMLGWMAAPRANNKKKEQ